jgi:hypothetical protein
MYGRTSVAQSLEVAAAYRAGHIVAEHFRGRSCWTAPVQAAEAWLRERLGRWEIDAVLPIAHEAAGEWTEVELAVADGRWRVRVADAPAAEPRPLSCGTHELESPPGYRVVVAEPVPN